MAFINVNRKYKTIDDLKEAIDKLPYMMTDTDLRNYLGDSIPIVKYGDLDNLNDIEQILPHNNSCVILLIETKHNSGHFVAICRRDNLIIQFDSYGSTIDYELNFISKMMQSILGMEKRALTELIKKSDCDTIHNTTKYQSTKKICNKESAICGRACIVFCELMKMGYDLVEMKIFMDNLKEEYERHYDVDLPYDIIFSLLIK
jgi:hypothetical protein